MKQILFILIFIFYSTKIFFGLEVDLGEIIIIDHSENQNEKQDEISSFTRVINIKENNFNSIDEILEKECSITIHSTGGDAGIKTSSIRGSSSKQVLVLIDGVPINSSGNNEIDLSTISLDSIKKIEIIRGGDSSLYGSNAVGGVINIITKKGDKNYKNISIFFEPSKKIGGDFSFSFKKKKFDLFFNINTLYDKGNFIFYNNNNTVYNTVDDFYDIRKNNEVLKTNSMFGISFDFKKDMKLSIKSIENFKRNGVAGPQNFPITDAKLQNLNFINNVLYDFGNINSYFTTKLQIYHNISWKNYNSNEENGGLGLHFDTVSNLFGLKNNFIFFSVPHNIFYVDILFEGEMLNNTLFSQIPYRFNFAIGFKDEVLLLNEQIELLPSIRITVISDYIYKVVPSGKLGFYYSTKNKVFKIKSNIFTSFRMPSFNELYYTYGYTEGNKELEPEYGFGGDFGIYFQQKKIFIEAVVFCSYFINLIQYTLSHGFIYKPINIGKSISTGIEFTTHFTPLSFLNIEFNYTFNYIFDADNESTFFLKQTPFFPLHKFVFTTELLFNNFKIGFSALLESWITLVRSSTSYNNYNVNDFAYYLSMLFLAGSKIIQPKVLLDVYLKVNLVSKINKRFSAIMFVEFKNILNQKIYDYRNFPLEGFRIEGGINFKF